MTINHPGIEIYMNDQIAIIPFYDLEDKVMNLAQKKLEEFGMPKANRGAGSVYRIISRESEYNLEELKQYISTANKSLVTQN